jgi:hypothetical protein
MNAILALLAISAVVGLVLGRCFSWIAILISGPIIALVSATELRNQDLGIVAGIAISVVCLAVNQIAFWIGVTRATRGRKDR